MSKEILDFLASRKFGIVVCVLGALSNLFVHNLPAAFWAGALAAELYLTGRKTAA